MSDASSRLIVALDVPDRARAVAAVDRLAGRAGVFKLGLEIFVSEGPSLVNEITGRGEKVFLDLKLHDIPNTVAGAVRAACRLGVQMLTVHAGGGPAMLEAAQEAASSSPAPPPLLLAVTALTSLSARDIFRMGIDERAESWVQKLADLAVESGIPGLVCSPGEVSLLRRKHGGQIQLVVPGIRPAGSAAQDQSRSATPEDAIRAGADYIVVGRPILQAPDPVHAADRILAEIELGLAGSGASQKP